MIQILPADDRRSYKIDKTQQYSINNKTKGNGKILHCSSF